MKKTILLITTLFIFALCFNCQARVDIGSNLVRDRVKAKSMTVNINQFRIEVGDTKKIEYEISPYNTWRQEVTWTSEDETIAIVRNGTVKAISEGVTYVRVSVWDSGVYSRIQVTVVPVGKLQIPKTPLWVYAVAALCSVLLAFIFTVIIAKIKFKGEKNQ